MPNLTTKLQSILNAAYEHRVASVLALRVGDVSITLSPRGLTAGANDQAILFDLASLTKILGTGLSFAKLCAEGKIDLNERPFKSWPDVTLSSLLSHTSGLPAHIKFYEIPGIGSNFVRNKRLMLDALYGVKNDLPKIRRYSDLNFLALGDYLERREKKPLWDIFDDVICEAVGRNSLGYLPSPQPSPASGRGRKHLPSFPTSICGITPFLLPLPLAGEGFGEGNHVAPTGYCPVREVRVIAQVNDLNCYFMGGLAGHAGLFGTLEGVATMARFFLKAYKNPESPLEQAVKMFAMKGLAFDHRTPGGTIHALSPRTFGHLGFTGVSLWIDPDLGPHGTAITLLTNRVNESLSPHGIFWLRRKIHSAIAPFFPS